MQDRVRALIGSEDISYDGVRPLRPEGDSYKTAQDTGED